VLPPEDLAYLERQGYQWTAQPEANLLCIVIKDLPLPAGYQVPRSDLLVRLPFGFPDATPDMWWFDPPLRLAASGSMPPGTEAMETHVGRTWQRWSRHFSSGAWRPGRSGLESYLTLMRKDLEKWVPR
jgi:hypothetical protein